MTDNPSCGTCRHAEPAIVANLDGEGPDAVLLCRRYPPVMVADDDGFGPIWPLVAESIWCGEYTPRATP